MKIPPYIIAIILLTGCTTSVSPDGTITFGTTVKDLQDINKAYHQIYLTK